MNKSKLILFTFAVAILIAADQIAKYLIRTSGGFYICNKNFAFGLKFSYLAIFILLLILAISLNLVENHKSKISSSKQIQNNNLVNSKRGFGNLNFGNCNLFSICNFEFGALALIFIISGALSNIIDRVMSGCVLDFIDLKFWPVFNLADIYISGGVILLLIQSAKFKVQN